MQEASIFPGELLLPGPQVNPTAWACVACDQYTSQPDYWREAEALVGDHPSALRLILPEIYLNDADARIPAIHETMRAYLAAGVLQPRVRHGYVLVERSTGQGTRLGLVALLDLETYEFTPGTVKPVRATEGTILERIPPRLQIRRGAPLELSHVLVLYDDALHTVTEPLHDRRQNLQTLYDFPLMLGGGHIKGYAVTEQSDLDAVSQALGSLQTQGGMLFAVGDGNHSLATAKAYWEEIKKTLPAAAHATHPARFAMVELENIHSEALVFEPIHRVLTGFDGDDLLTDLQAYAVEKGWALASGGKGHRITVVYEGKEVTLNVSGSGSALAVGALQTFLDAWMRGRPGVALDYVHGEETARTLSRQANTVAFLLPALHKNELFPAVEQLGILPRKTFSMGEAHEKRYYVEARKIQP